MSKSCIFGCENFTHLFNFPYNNEYRLTQLKNWCDILEISIENVNSHIRICDKHFLPKYIGKMRLLMGAIPEKPSPALIERLPKTLRINILKFQTGQELPVENKTTNSDSVRSIHPTSVVENVQLSKDVDTRDSVEVNFKTPPKRTYLRNDVCLKRRKIDGSDDKNYHCYCSCHNKGEINKMLSIINLLKQKSCQQAIEIQNLRHQIEAHERQHSDNVIVIQNFKKAEIKLRHQVAINVDKVEEIKKKSIIPFPKVDPKAIHFCKMICSGRKNFNVAEKNISQSIFLTSRKCYNFLRDELHFSLPHSNSLLRWRPVKKVEIGIDPLSKENLKKMVSTFNKRERQALLLFDEMEVRKEIEYSKSEDIIDGFEDHGEHERYPKLASKALVFMLKGCCSNWKYIMSFYALSKAATGEQLNRMVAKNIDAAMEIGLDIRAIVCDQGPGNQRLFNIIFPNKRSPSFMYNEKEIIFLWDYPHIIKNIRNNLFSTGYVKDNKKINKAPILAVYEHDKNNFNTKLCPKLTERHIHLSPWDKMNVARAVQIFSHTMAAAIETLITDGILTDSAKPTKEFIQAINNLFDEMNVKNLYSPNPNNLPIKRGCSEKIEKLKDGITYLKGVSTNKNNVKCIQGMIQTLSGTIRLSEIIFQECEEVEYILPGKFSQDSLENTFSRFRALGHNSHPSVREIRHEIARYSSTKILNSARGSRVKNCESDEASFLDWNSEVRSKILQRNTLDQSGEIKSFLDNLDYEECQPGITELQSERYVLGYTLYKSIVLKSKCDNCIKSMTKATTSNTGSEAFISAKNYKQNSLCLTNPNDEVFVIMHFVMMWYKKAYKEFVSKDALKKNLHTAIIHKLNADFDGFLKDDGCRDHKLNHLDYLLRVLILKNTKWMSEEMVLEDTRKSAQRKKLKKLNVPAKNLY